MRREARVEDHLRPTTYDSPLTQILRKEVIQPHLPIRLPCYDFVPLAPHTFGG